MKQSLKSFSQGRMKRLQRLNADYSDTENLSNNLRNLLFHHCNHFQMKNLKYLLLLLLSSLLWNGCRKDYYYIQPQVVVTTPVSFQTDITTIFANKCAAICHKSGGAFPGLDLTAAKAYDQLWTTGVNAPYIDTTNAESSLLYKKISGGTMDIYPTAEEKEKILAWIKQGAKNN